MKESFWGIMIFVFGVVSILIVFFFQSLTNTSEHNYVLLKEATEGAMIDAIDLAYYREKGLIRIDQEKFVENFVRRFAQSAQLSRDYVIEIYDVSEEPPKVSLAISSVEKNSGMDEVLDFNLIDRLDAILEMPKDFCHYDTIVEASQSVVINIPTQLNQNTHWEKEGGEYTSDRDDSVADNGRYKIVCTKNSTGKYTCQKYVRVSNTANNSSSSSSSSSSSQTQQVTTKYVDISVSFEEKFTGNTSNGKIVTWVKSSSKTQTYSYNASSTGTNSKRVCKCSKKSITSGKETCVQYTCQDYQVQKGGTTEDNHVPERYYKGNKNYPFHDQYTSSSDESGMHNNGRFAVTCVCTKANSYTTRCKLYTCDRYIKLG